MELVLLVLSLTVCASSARVELSAKKLYTDLMTKKQYNPLIKPSGDAVGKLTVKLGMRLHSLLDVDEKNQVISLKVKLHHEWKDLRLRWTPDEYGGVRMLFIPSNDLWRPDIVLYNNADGEFAITIKTKATVHYDGRIVWEPVAIYKSYCPINVEFFPFDIQKCFLKFGSWTYNGDEVDLQHMCDGVDIPDKGQIIRDGIDISHYYKNSEWKLINITARRKEKFYACCPEPYPDITFFITIQRHPLFFTLNLIMPCVSISCLTVLVFYLPSDSREKISLSISILLALTVFFLLLSEINPPTSFVIPLIGKYLLFVMIVVTMSIFLTVYTLHINFKTPTTHKMSPWVRRVFTEILPKILLIKRPDNDGKPKIPKDTRNGMEMREPTASASMTQDWQLYENLRQHSDESESVSNFCPEVRDAFKGVEFIADHMKSTDTDLAEIRDWKYVAMVIDRFFLFIFTAATFSGTLSIFLCAPSLYDDRKELHRDYNSSCIF